ncbi:hypothetical protein EOA27_14385, partial [Mesorhizobium sp. M2A.F.Ca.ET.037.01.1.1]|uniref:hypothetical protein n=1 Tax=Mesorhizobium sp. M2A.F.Ca.ET.037.01.1.1 TaxID=2496748 RepID=UPI000FD52657
MPDLNLKTKHIVQIVRTALDLTSYIKYDAFFEGICLNTANHAAFADLSRPLLSPLPLTERERLAGAWRMAS